jgi:hypothetical protein
MLTKTEKPKPKKRRGVGLLDLLGHTYVDDRERSGQRMIQYQFEIIRRMHGDRYVVQYFSFATGDPTQVGVMTEAELLNKENARLYADAEIWRERARLEGDDRREELRERDRKRRAAAAEAQEANA